MHSIEDKELPPVGLHQKTRISHLEISSYKKKGHQIMFAINTVEDKNK
jgi:hypothetical protein